MAKGDRQLFPYIMLAGSIALVVVGYFNSRLPPEFEPVARDAACTVAGTCIVTRERPNAMRSDPIQRRYEFETTEGPVLVTCRREFLVAGGWKCAAQRGSFTGL